jgi:cell fate (sporulation/competence/biofilm development) regulator YlbF (YheA/YmcA/DUF963 family)
MNDIIKTTMEIEQALSDLKETLKRPGVRESMLLKVAVKALEEIDKLETSPWEGIDQRRIARAALKDIRDSIAVSKGEPTSADLYLSEFKRRLDADEELSESFRAEIYLQERAREYNSSISKMISDLFKPNTKEATHEN